MNKFLYEKIAITDIKKNPKIYLPYLLTIIGSMMFCYILFSIGANTTIYNPATGFEGFEGASLLCGILGTGSFVAAAFAFIFLLYANSFVLKQQKRQFGLYRVLGMERRHIVRIITTEILLIFLIGFFFALFLGILFDKLMLVFLFKIIGQTAPIGFIFSLDRLLHILKLTAGISAIVLFRSIFSILSAKDVELLKSDKMGEKEPKNRPLLTLVGIAFLGIGYKIALTSAGAAGAINNFVPAALCVMIATYILFIAGSVFILKTLKGNKNFYYTTRHFISVSNLLYRMKQNASGLATICILSSAAVVVLSAGAALYTNGEYSINQQFPRMMHFNTLPADKAVADEMLQKTLLETSVSAEDIVTCTYASSLFVKTETGIAPMDYAKFEGFDKMPDTFILTLEEYNRFNQTSETLQNTEILLYASDNFYTKDTLTFLDETYRIKGTANNDCLSYISDVSMTFFSKLLIVVPNEEVLQKFTSTAVIIPEITWTGFDINQSGEESIAFANALSQAFTSSGIDFELCVKQQEQDFFYNMYGGILFVGIVLGILFLLCTVMIIYYKQISEGYEDKSRFLIMQKVGLSKQEIKKSIHSQIMIVFFLPLIVAIIHASVALKIVANCLRLVIVVHMPTFIMSVAVICVLFSICYMIVYKITSKEYYNIVNE